MDGNEAGGKDFKTKNMELQHTEIKKQANKSKNEGWSSQWGLTDGEIKAKHKNPGRKKRSPESSTETEKKSKK